MMAKGARIAIPHEDIAIYHCNELEEKFIHELGPARTLVCGENEMFCRASEAYAVEQLRMRLVALQSGDEAMQRSELGRGICSL
jgi:hypothetical protein